jgi:rod shape-determining protein MreC
VIARERGARRRIVVFGVLVVACLAMLAVSDSAPVAELRRGVNYAVAPVQGTLADGTRSVTEVLGAVGEIEALRRENTELRDSVEQLQDQVAAFEAMSEEHRRLTRLLEVRDRVDHATVTAGVIGRQATQFERVLTIDRGSAAGIRQGDPVLSEGGALAGRISEVGENWSAVMLISDTRSLVIGLDSRTRATGEVTGRLSAPLAMENIPRTDRIEVNDRVVTAGIALGRRFQSAFPKGIPIGRVVDVQAESGAIVQTALVQPTADLDRIEDVLVIVDLDGRRRARTAEERPDEEAPADAETEEGQRDAEAGSGDAS